MPVSWAGSRCLEPWRRAIRVEAPEFSTGGLAVAGHLIPGNGQSGCCGDTGATFGPSTAPRATAAGASTLAVSDFGASDLPSSLEMIPVERSLGWIAGRDPIRGILWFEYRLGLGRRERLVRFDVGVGCFAGGRGVGVRRAGVALGRRRRSRGRFVLIIACRCELHGIAGGGRRGATSAGGPDDDARAVISAGASIGGAGLTASPSPLSSLTTGADGDGAGSSGPDPRSVGSRLIDGRGRWWRWRVIGRCQFGRRRCLFRAGSES